MRFVLLIVSLFIIQPTFSQTNTPVGIWEISGHRVRYKLKPDGQSWSTMDVFNSHDQVKLQFRENGIVTRTTINDTAQGVWNLKRSGKKFEIIFERDFKYTNTSKGPFNFEDGFDMREKLDSAQYFTTDSLSGGRSEYERITGVESRIDSNEIIGDWKVISKSSFKKIVVDSLITFLESGHIVLTNSDTALDGKSGYWKINGLILSLFIIDRSGDYFDSWFSFRIDDLKADQLSLYPVNNHQKIKLERPRKNTLPN
jgi:hypothetical protein